MNLSLLEWSWAQFALTAAFHWIFAPLACGLTFMIAIMETVYVKTGNSEWKQHLTFWMKIFGATLALCIATGLVVVFEFAANWSNCSWFAGDVINTPLIAVIFVFFIETSFLSMMFFGWNRLGKKTHLTSTWLVFFGLLSMSMLILAANAWMQHPVGTDFNIETARLEMNSFEKIIFSPVAVNKFLHTVASSFVLTSVFVIGINARFLLNRSKQSVLRKSMRMSAITGLLSSLFLFATGIASTNNIAEYQPLKFAALDFKIGNNEDSTATVEDLVNCSEEFVIMSVEEKIERGMVAQQLLKEYREEKQKENEEKANVLYERLNDSIFN
jgi:cytochrome d ubiquinol oxidase subunit I